MTVRDLRTRPAEVWKALGDSGELVITSNGRPIAVLTPATSDTLDGFVTAVRRARALQAVSDLQQASVRAGRERIGPAAIEAEIRAVRKRRRR